MTARSTTAAKKAEDKPSDAKPEDQAQVTTEGNPVDDRKNVAENPEVQKIAEDGKPLDGAPTPSGATADPKGAPDATAPSGLPTPQAAGTAQEIPKGSTKSRSVKDLTAEDLVDQSTGHPRPLSAQTDNLSASVSGDLGRVLVKLSVRGYIGEEPVVLRGEDIDELRKIADMLDKAAQEQTKASKK